MASQTICVPLNSPAWRDYLREGWIERWREGGWVVMSRPQPAFVPARH